MKPATVALVVAGVALLAGGLWAAAVLPIRSQVNDVNGEGRKFRNTISLNLWGRALHEVIHIEYLNEAAKPVGENVGHISDEFIAGGPLDSTGSRHGLWTFRRRDGTTWAVSVAWHLHGIEVSGEEWERQ